MGRIVVTEFVSLDGVMEGPGGDNDFARGAWSFEFDRGEDGDKFKTDETMDAEALLLGRKTYEGFAAAWPERSATRSPTSSTTCPSTWCRARSRIPSGTTRP